MKWTPACRLHELPVGSTRLFSTGEHRIALVRSAERLFAVDNACPHEGYPLIQGDVRGHLLTCIWHNYKFDLRDGACVMGEEDVRSWPVRVVDDLVEVGIEERPVPIERLFASLETGLHQRRVGQAARDLTRLLAAGISQDRLLGWVAAYDARFAEWGSTHVLPLAADLGAYAPHEQPELVLMQAFELASETHVRRPERAPPKARFTTATPAQVADQLRRKVEAEQAVEAEALLRGALNRGWGPREVEPMLFGLCADHFLDFGHALIYSSKVCGLLSRAGWEEFAPSVLGTLVYGITNGTREDLLPQWAGWRKRVAQLDLQALWARRIRGGPPTWDRSGVQARMVHGKAPDAFAALVQALEQGLPVADLLDLLALGACERMLRLDLSHDPNPELQNGWLDVSHILTFAVAVREVLERWEDPRCLLLVFQLLHFVNMAKALDGAPQPVVRERGDLAERIRAGDVDGAIGVAAASPPEQVAALLMDLPLRDIATRPIVVAHLIKTAVAARTLHRELRGDASATLPLLACVRFFTAPKDQRFLQRRVFDAVGLVREGRIPRTLT